jgi:hypothetical protein
LQASSVPELLLLASLVIRGGFFSLKGGVTIAIPATLFVWVASTSLVDAGGRSLGGPESTI